MSRKFPDDPAGSKNIADTGKGTDVNTVILVDCFVVYVEGYVMTRVF